MKAPLSFALLLTALPAFAEPDNDEIAKQLQNPVAPLISVPFQFNYDTKMGPLDDGSRLQLNFQPVVPLKLNEDWNLIVRTIVPYIWQEDVFKGPRPSFPGLPPNLLNTIPPGLRGSANDRARRAFDREVSRTPVDRHQNGLGDITQTFFFSPGFTEKLGFKLGIGPAFLYPTATDDLLGGEQWAAGPSLLLLKQKSGWTTGVLANHLWSFAGDDSRNDLNATFVQPFISYTTKKHTTFGLNAESTYDWNAGQWTLPLNASVSQLVRLGKMPVSFGIGGRYYADGPSGAPEWGVRFIITLVFPESHSAPAGASEGKGFRK